jgi:hypothetical protein
VLNTTYNSCSIQRPNLPSSGHLPASRCQLLKMKKESAKRRGNELRREYDLARLKGGVRGKYCQRAAAGTNLILLEPDVAQSFPDSVSVNRALRLLRDVAKTSAGRSRNRERRRARALHRPHCET